MGVRELAREIINNFNNSGGAGRGQRVMNKGKAGIFAQIKRFIFVLVILVGLMFLGGEGGGFWRFFVAGCCFLFAWGAWKNWASVRELGQEQEKDDYKW